VHDCARYAADIRDEASPCPERILHIRNVSRVYIYLIQYHLTILYYYYSTLHHRGIMYYVFGGSPLASSRSIRRSVGLACRPPLIARQSIITSRQCRIFFFWTPISQHPNDTDSLSSPLPPLPRADIDFPLRCTRVSEANKRGRVMLTLLFILDFFPFPRSQPITIFHSNPTDPAAIPVPVDAARYRAHHQEFARCVRSLVSSCPTEGLCVLYTCIQKDHRLHSFFFFFFFFLFNAESSLYASNAVNRSRLTNIFTCILIFVSARFKTIHILSVSYRLITLSTLHN